MSKNDRRNTDALLRRRWGGIVSEQMYQYMTEEEKKFIIRIYENYRKFLLNVARKILKDAMLAEDAVSEVFSILIERREYYLHTPDEQLKSFLYAVTRNCALKYLRDWVRGNNLISLETMEDCLVSDRDSSFDEKVLSDIRYEELIRSIEDKNPKEMQILNLRVKHDRSFDEISSILSVSEAAVRSRYYRAREKVADYLEKQE